MSRRPRAGWGPLALAAALLAALAAQALHVSLRKSAQRLAVQPDRQIAKGPARGQVSGTAALAGDAAGRLWVLDPSQGAWRIQRFSPGLIPEAEARLVLAAPPVGLASDRQGRLWLGLADGGLLALGPDLKETARLRAPVSLRDLTGDGEGGFWALDAAGKRALRFGPDGLERPVQGDLKKGFVLAKSLASAGEGRLAVMFQAGGGQTARVYGADGSLTAAFPLPVPWGLVNRMACAGGLLLFNENKVGKGLWVCRLDGRSVGRVVSLGGMPLPDQGYVGANPYTGQVFVDHPQGLARFRPEWGAL